MVHRPRELQPAAGGGERCDGLVERGHRLVVPFLRAQNLPLHAPRQRKIVRRIREGRIRDRPFGQACGVVEAAAEEICFRRAGHDQVASHAVLRIAHERHVLFVPFERRARVAALHRAIALRVERPCREDQLIQLLRAPQGPLGVHAR